MNELLNIIVSLPSLDGQAGGTAVRAALEKQRKNREIRLQEITTRVTISWALALTCAVGHLAHFVHAHIPVAPSVGAVLNIAHSAPLNAALSLYALAGI